MRSDSGKGSAGAGRTGKRKTLPAIPPAMRTKPGGPGKGYAAARSTGSKNPSWAPYAPGEAREARTTRNPRQVDNSRVTKVYMSNDAGMKRLRGLIPQKNTYWVKATKDSRGKTVPGYLAYRTGPKKGLPVTGTVALTGSYAPYGAPSGAGKGRKSETYESRKTYVATTSSERSKSGGYKSKTRYSATPTYGEATYVNGRNTSIGAKKAAAAGRAARKAAKNYGAAYGAVSRTQAAKTGAEGPKRSAPAKKKGK